MSNFIEKYNPKNWESLAEADIAAMQSLSDAQIHELAKAYPNESVGNDYLVLFDTSIKNQTEQLFPLSTWKNLHDLRTIGQARFKAYGFKGNLAKSVHVVATAKTVQVDLSNEEIASAEGIKTSEGENTSAQATDTAQTDTEDESVAQKRQEIEAAKAAGAHPQTIKKLERELDALINKN